LKFVRFYHRALRDQEARVERVDLRYSNGFAVRWKRAENHK
jgi:cell division septal protein FtsQ